MIYISAPYNHEHKQVVIQRIEAVYRKFAELMMKGEIPVTPLMAHAVIEKHPVPSSSEFWEEYSITLLSKCSRMVVLKLDGWDISTGVAYEISYATRNNIEIVYEF